MYVVIECIVFSRIIRKKREIERMEFFFFSKRLSFSFEGKIDGKVLP